MNLIFSLVDWITTTTKNNNILNKVSKLNWYRIWKFKEKGLE